MKASTVVNKSLTQTNQAFNTPTPIIIQMGSNYQPTSSQLASPLNRLPSIAEFLSNLDQNMNVIMFILNLKMHSLKKKLLSMQLKIYQMSNCKN